MSSRIDFSHIFFLMCLGFLFYLVWLMAEPLVAPIIFAGILVGAFYPVNHFFTHKLRFSSKISSLITCVIIFVSVIVPLIYVGARLSQEVISFYQFVREGITQAEVKSFFYGSGRFAKLFAEVTKFLGLTPKKIEANILEIAQFLSSYTIGFINSWLGNLLALFVKFTVMIIVTYGLLNWGDDFKRYLFKLSPLPEDQEEMILLKFNQMNRVTLIGNGVGGVIQGSLAGVAFGFAGIESVFMWSVIMVLLAFIPLVGISVVYIPACVYLFLTGKATTAILLFLFCSLVAFFTENWFKPKFMGNQVKINSILVLIFILAGMGAWGMVGIFYGPVICIVVMTMVDIYHQRYAKDLVFNKDIR